MKNRLYFPVIAAVAMLALTLAVAAEPAAERKGIYAEAVEQGAKMVDHKWRWFQDYAFASSKWTVKCPVDRQCQVGMGIKIRHPLGEKIRFSGMREFTTIGAGSIHVKVVDGKGPCPVELKQGAYGLVSHRFKW